MYILNNNGNFVKYTSCKVKLNIVVEIFEVLDTIPDLLYLNSNVARTRASGCERLIMV